MKAARARLQNPDLLASLLIFLATCVFFYKLFRGASFSTVQMYEDAIYPWKAHPNGLGFFPQSDQAALSYPWQCLYERALRFREAAFWDPYSYLVGYPLASNGSSAVFSPVRLLATLLTSNPERAHDAFCFLCVLFSGLAAYACARAFAVKPCGALFCGLSWMFCGWNLSWLHLEVVAPLGFNLPLLVLCVRKGVQLRRRSWVPAGAAAVALTLISGHVLLMGVVCVAGAGQLAVTVLITLFRKDLRGAWAQARDGAVLFGLGALLAGFVLVPTALNLLGSARQPFSWDELRAMWLGNWKSFTVRVLVPPSLPITAIGMHEMGFVGTAAGLLSVWGALRRSAVRWAGILFWAVPAAVALGTPLTWLAYHFLPAFNVFRPYSRLVFVSAFGACLLAGAGLDGLLEVPALLRMRPGAAAAVILANTIQLVWYGHEVNPPLVPATMPAFPDLPSIDALRAGSNLGPSRWPARILPLRVNDAEGSWSPVLFGAFGPVLGLVVATGYDSAVPERTVDALRVLSGEPVAAVLASRLPVAYTPSFDSMTFRADLLPRLGVNLVLAGPQQSQREIWAETWSRLSKKREYEGAEGRVYLVVGADSGPYLATRVVAARDAADALARLVSGPFERGADVILEREDLSDSPATSPPAGPRERPRLLQWTVDGARLAIAATAPQWLVLPIAWSAGWRASVDGGPARTAHANYSEMAVLVPAGARELELHFRPPGWTAGVCISLAAAIALLSFPFLRKRPC